MINKIDNYKVMLKSERDQMDRIWAYFSMNQFNIPSYTVKNLNKTDWGFNQQPICLQKVQLVFNEVHWSLKSEFEILLNLKISPFKINYYIILGQIIFSIKLIS